jgi:hypothetical protein
LSAIGRDIYSQLARIPSRAELIVRAAQNRKLDNDTNCIYDVTFFPGVPPNNFRATFEQAGAFVQAAYRFSAP